MGAERPIARSTVGTRVGVILALSSLILGTLVALPARAGVLSNLVVNPGFETGDQRWSGAGKVVTSKAHSGIRALLINGKAGGPQMASQLIDVTGGTSYEASGWFSVAKLRTGARILVQWRTGAGAIIDTVAVGRLKGSSSWKQRTASLIAPNQAAEARLMLRVERERDGKGRAWFDDLAFGPSSNAPDFLIEEIETSPVSPTETDTVSFSATVRNQGADATASSTRLRLDVGNDGAFDVSPDNESAGALLSGGTTTVTWSDVWAATTGTHRVVICADTPPTIPESDETNNCEQLIFGVGEPPNLLVNPSFENGRWGKGGTLVTTPVHDGSFALQLGVSMTNPKTGGQTIPVESGAGYDVSGWISVSELSGGAGILLKWLAPDGSVLLKQPIGTPFNGTADYAQASASVVAPAGATDVRFTLRMEVEPDGIGLGWFDHMSFIPA